ncbi:CoA-transferase [Salinactinospora qingdaonensis]|uniref:Methyltransferase domain-containing protein n=1 Tax=Salinactinospora qingdaonensis TaxID=702744 RepID=A0ABP7F5C9_9ACTN
MSTDPAVLGFLAHASEYYADGATVFTGFHWPVLAAELAARLRGDRFTHYFEAGVACGGQARQLATSTTDYAAYHGSHGFSGAMADVLFGLAPRFDLAVLDAGTVDMAGRVNATAVGDLAAPRVRLPGGGGAADIAGGARDLLLLHGGHDPRRLQRRVDHVTAAPGENTRVRLLTRWGLLRLGRRPYLLERFDTPGHTAFTEQLTHLGVAHEEAPWAAPVAPTALRAAERVLIDAAHRGYAVAARALATDKDTTHD